MSPPTPDDERVPDRLRTARLHIDAIDHQIVDLLARRNDLVGEVASIKREQRLKVRDHRRERSILLDRRRRARALGLSPDVVEGLFRAVLWASRDRQAALKVELPQDEPQRTVAVIGGHGAMGSVMVNLFSELGHEVLIVDLATELTPEEAAVRADVVIISVPIDCTVKMIEQVGPLVRREALLMDVTSIKAGPVKAMLRTTEASVLGTHPLFGPSVHSLQGQRIVITTPEQPRRSEAHEAWLDWTERMFASRGMRITRTTPAMHDRMMAIVQVLTHFSTEVMGRTLSRSGVSLEETRAFMSPVYRMELLMTARHFAQSPELYADLQMENPQTPRVVRDFLDAACEIADAVAKRDRDEFLSMFEEVRQYVGDFAGQALEQSSYLMDRLVERS